MSNLLAALIVAVALFSVADSYSTLSRKTAPANKTGSAAVPGPSSAAVPGPSSAAVPGPSSAAVPSTLSKDNGSVYDTLHCDVGHGLGSIRLFLPTGESALLLPVSTSDSARKHVIGMSQSQFLSHRQRGRKPRKNKEKCTFYLYTDKASKLSVTCTEWCLGDNGLLTISSGRRKLKFVAEPPTNETLRTKKMKVEFRLGNGGSSQCVVTALP